MPSRSFTDFDVLRKGTTELLTTFVRDPKTGDLVDVIGTSTFNLINIEGDVVEFTTTFNAAGGSGITRVAPGAYQYSMNTTTYPGEYIASWRCVLDGDIVTNNIFIKSVPSKLFARAAALRVQVDKARKSISDDIENMDRQDNDPAITFFYGYTDAHLIYYLERGAQFINIIPPYTALTPVSFPWSQYGMILTDAAVIAALESQGIFAIDTDYDYSLGANRLVIDHWAKISGMLNTLIARFDKSVVPFKQQFRSKGMVMFQWMPGGVRAARQLNAQPAGFWSRMLSSAFV